MAIEHGLRGNLIASTAYARTLLVDLCPLVDKGETEILLGRFPGLTSEPRGMMITFEGLCLTCYLQDDSLLGKSIIGDAYAIPSSHVLTFRIDKFRYEEGILEMFQICAVAMRELFGDCVILKMGLFHCF